MMDFVDVCGGWIRRIIFNFRGGSSETLIIVKFVEFVW